MSEILSEWMSWEGGIDLLATTDPSLAQPNVIINIARMVHTPAGSAPSGIVFWQPDPGAPPEVIGFVSTDPAVGAYFGPKIFAGTPFEHAPVLIADFEFAIATDSASARLAVAGHVFEIKFSGLGPLHQVHRSPIATAPFFQQGAEAIPAEIELKVDGKIVPITIPPIGITGGPAAVLASYGSYAR